VAFTPKKILIGVKGISESKADKIIAFGEWDLAQRMLYKHAGSCSSASKSGRAD